ncbi:hypothetical protein [Haladaptatus sp. T7]|uniref:hypothetical protein n=1 Tax=Haladaptatus sp. T7 TaxID=2029368 RepID=UPI0021A259AE|nr:hypothetical protein [Haladaptatus sp. T7]GKZ12414.1 hypothetical protein HAL_02950 [Haladaptatus sp. T7]
MSDNEPSSEKRIAIKQVGLRFRGIDADDVDKELLGSIHAVLDEQGLPVSSISVEPREPFVPRRTGPHRP